MKQSNRLLIISRSRCRTVVEMSSYQSLRTPTVSSHPVAADDTKHTSYLSECVSACLKCVCAGMRAYECDGVRVYAHTTTSILVFSLAD